MNNQTVDERKRERLQALANEKQSKVYIYELSDGNRFDTLDIRMRGETIGGAHVSKLIDIINPEKGTNNGQA